MPTQTDTQSHIARKVNFAIQLLRESYRRILVTDEVRRQRLELAI